MARAGLGLLAAGRSVAQKYSNRELPSGPMKSGCRKSMPLSMTAMITPLPVSPFAPPCTIVSARWRRAQAPIVGPKAAEC